MQITFTDDKKGKHQSVTAKVAVLLDHPDYNVDFEVTAWGESEQQAETHLWEALKALRSQIPEKSVS